MSLTRSSPLAEPADTVWRGRVRELELLVENFPEGALYQYAISPNGRRRLMHLGRSAERIFGELPPELPIDIGWLSARIHPDDEPHIAAAGDRSHRELSPFKHEVRIRARDGTERWVSIRSQPRAEPDGTIVWDGAIIDVTERRRAEDAARRQAAFLATLNETTLELLGRRNVPELLGTLVDRASALLKSPHAEISLLEGDELVVRAYSRGRDYLAGDRVRRGESALSWRAIDTHQPVVVAHYAEHGESREVYRQRGIEAAAVFPILRGGHCAGVLGVARHAPSQPFTEEDIREGTLLAQMAALVLHNAAIYEDAVRAAESRTAALRESEQRFRGVFDKSPIMIGVVSLPDGRMVELNEAVLATFGFTREEAIGKTTLELGIWVDPGQRERYLARVASEGHVSGFEADMRRKNGEIITVVHSASILTLGGRTYSLSSLQDITARKQSEAARDRTLALMRATLESTADGILVVNAEGRIETYNRNFAEMWDLAADYTPDGAAEDHALRTILAQLDSPERFLASVRDVYSGSEDEFFDVLTCRDGRVLERFSRPQLLGSRVVGRVWSFRDITNSRRAEAALRQSEERFRVLAEVSPVGIFSTDPEGRTVFVNNRWCEIAGLSAAEAMGEGWQRALHPDDRQSVADNWSQAVRLGESSAAEFRFVRPDGSVSWLVGQSRAQRHADGTLAGYVGTVTDVTHLKRAEEERKRFEAQQRQSRKMESLGTLAGGIAHDFNNILTGTFGFVELARETLPPDHPAAAWLDRIGISSQRARDLVRQILTFSRKTEGARLPQRVHGVVTEALKLLRTTLPPMVTLESSVSPLAPPVRADATQIHQVVINLCTNAWHALPARGGRIAVVLEPWFVTAEEARQHPDLRAGPCARLTVADNGVGMDAHTLEHIFEPFFTTKETGAGTGLGLAVVHGIVTSHEGAILVRSAPDAGSTFEVYLPAIEEPAPTAPVFTPDAPRGQGERVLVVDDDAVSGFAIEKMIEMLGYAVKRHTRPEEALAEFSAAPDRYDLVVSDLAMPGMNGAELIQHLMRIRADLPVIVVTGFIETERQRMLEQAAARAVLHKPVSRDELARAVAQHVRRRA
jgi:PAS domain S-box-containing protein